MLQLRSLFSRYSGLSRMTVVLIIATLSTLAGFLFVENSSERFFNLDFIFAIVQGIFTVSGLALLDINVPGNDQYVVILCLPFFIYCFTSFAMRLMSKRAVRNQIGKNISTASKVVVVPTRRRVLVVGLCLLSIAVVSAYYIAVGYNVFFDSMMASLRGDGLVEDVASRRFDTYSQDNYLFPGYVNQFKNILLPATSAVIIHWMYVRGSKFRFLTSASLVIITVFALLGTGQRAAFVYAVGVVVVFVFYVSPSLFRRWAPLGGIAAFSMFLLSTFFLGRDTERLDLAEGAFEQVWVVASTAMSRFFVVSQETALIAFHYIKDLPIQNGREWLDSFRGILPGYSGSTLSFEIYEVMFGTDRGTAPPSVWLSVFHNFGWIGIVAVPAVLAVAARLLVNQFNKHQEVNSLEAVGYAGVSVIAGVWSTGSPMFLFNFGAVTFGFLWILGILERRQASSRLNRPRFPAASF